MSRSRVLVTGGAGFIGSHLVDRLVAKEMEVIVLDNFHDGTKDNLKDSLSRIKIIEGDIRNHNLVNETVRECSPDIVFHLAANASVPNSVRDPRYDFEINVVGTFNVLHALIDQKVRKLVFASSAAVYGESSHILKESDPVGPVSPYGTSKLCGESIGVSFKRTYGIPFVIARIFNVYGPRLHRYVMYDFYMKLKKNPRTLEVMGSGKQVRQFCFVSDAVDALILIAEKGEDIYNIAGNEPVSIEKLAEIMVEKIASGAEISYSGTSWAGDIVSLLADINKLTKIGFEPEISLNEGIDILIKWFDENQNRIGHKQ